MSEELLTVALSAVATAFALFALSLQRPWTPIIRLVRGTKPSGPFSPANAAASYASYSTQALHEITLKRNALSKLGRSHTRLAREIGYPAKLYALRDATLANARVTDKIAAQANRALPSSALALPHRILAQTPPGELWRVREALKHLMRDWSAEGAAERARVFDPILTALQRAPPSERPKISVLVPGCGLGRLAWEISQLGFDTTAVDMSAFMLSALRLLLDPVATSAPEEHTIHPFAHWLAHQRTPDAVFRSVRVPDVVPRETTTFRVLEDDVLSLRGKYDIIVTLFFIDTAPDVLALLAHLHSLLNPTGAWINLGPLLWPAGAALELSRDELLSVARLVGFSFHDDADGAPFQVEDQLRMRSVECEYTADREAMMRWVYEAVFWVARRRDAPAHGCVL